MGGVGGFLLDADLTHRGGVEHCRGAVGGLDDHRELGVVVHGEEQPLEGVVRARGGGLGGGGSMEVNGNEATDVGVLELLHWVWGVGK